MKNKKLFNTIVKITLLSMVLAMSMFQFSVSPTKAAALTSISDTMSRLKAGTASNHSIQFTTPSGADENETITVTFSADFTMGSVDYTDIEVKDDGVSLTDAANCLGTEKAGIAVAGQVVTITICAGDGGAIAPNSVVTILIGTNASGGDAQITNGPADDDDTVSIAGTFGDTGTIVVDIITDDQIVVTATVDPTFTFTISSNTCALGTLTTGSVSTCGYTLAVGTNANNGAVITIQAISDGTNAYLNRDGAPDTYITDIPEDSLVTAGSEGYGIAVTAGSGWTEEGNFNDDDTPIPSIVTNILSTSGPILSSVTSTITHRAAISALTEAGTYSQTVQYIATGTF